MQRNKKRERNHNEDKNQSIAIDPEMTQVIEVIRTRY